MRVKPLRLRGHHLLCVHGFRGMGYSPSFVEKMKEIVRDIREEEKETLIQVVVALDEACFSCPHHGESTCQADTTSNDHVVSMDKKVLTHLGLEENAVYLKSELLRLTAKKVRPDDLDYLCANCSWLSYGVCKEGIAHLRQKNE
ncbi:hypothetical protein GGR02_002866 [Anoxybacillus voinovskiensis]|uniref:[Fe-S]-binding protein n=1 Tax=Anoxybacteroides voinovskiense TaxID=230470 RepID=A0A840DU13_9BACL|nr:hypothetical protein [Anoxybacillus voinovskiensis]GGJ76547.1 hypothetical protein GCM10008982_27320 [Anoxybacillus voinovskiensis]